MPDLLQNIAPLVDGYISWGDTRNKELWYHESSVRNGLIEAARSIGADWVLAVDPDERFEHRAAGSTGSGEKRSGGTCSPSGGDRPSTVYRSTHPRAEIQTIGYAYLTDESSLVLEPIPGGRDYQPAYRDDYRLTQTGPPARP